MDTVSTALTLAGNSDLKDQIGKFQDTREKRYAKYLSKVRRANSAAEEKALKKLTRANVGLAKAINNANNRTDKRTAKIEKAVSKINTKFDKKVAKMGSDVDAVKAMNIARSAAIQTKQDRGRDKGSLLNVIPNTINDYRKDKAKKATDMVTRARMNSELRNHLASNKVALAHLKRPFANTTPDAMIKNHLTGYKVSNTANFSELAYEIFSDTVENDTEEFNEVKQLARAFNKKPGRYRRELFDTFVPTKDSHKQLFKEIDNYGKSIKVGSGRVITLDSLPEGNLVYDPSTERVKRAKAKAKSRKGYLGNIHGKRYAQHVAKNTAERKARRTKEILENINRKYTIDRNRAIAEKLSAMDK